MVGREWISVGSVVVWRTEIVSVQRECVKGGLEDVRAGCWVDLDDLFRARCSIRSRTVNGIELSRYNAIVSHRSALCAPT
jgi:hypothetical protein